MVYAYYLVIGAGGKITAVGRESDGVNGAKVVAHVAELARFGVRPVVCIVNRIGRPYSNVAIWQCILETVQLLEGLKQYARIPPPAVASLEPSGETWQL